MADRPEVLVADEVIAEECAYLLPGADPAPQLMGEVKDSIRHDFVVEPPIRDLLALGLRVEQHPFERTLHHRVLGRHRRTEIQSAPCAPLAPGGILWCAAVDRQAPLEPFRRQAGHQRVGVDPVAPLAFKVGDEIIQVPPSLISPARHSGGMGDHLETVEVQAARQPERRVEVQKAEEPRVRILPEDVAYHLVHRREIVLAYAKPYRRIVRIRLAEGVDGVAHPKCAHVYAHLRERRGLRKLLLE